MMRDVERGYKKSRVWIGELPDASYAPERIIERDLSVALPRSDVARAVAAEVRIVTGPREHYGLLGAEFKPSDAGKLAVQIGVTGDDGPEYKASLLLASSPSYGPRIGLPEEYVEGVLAGFASADDLARVGAGTLHIAHAVHYPIGSAYVVFAALARTLAHLLATSEADLSDDRLAALLFRL